MSLMGDWVQALRWVWVLWYALGVVAARIFGRFGRADFEEKLTRMDTETWEQQGRRLEYLQKACGWAAEAAVLSKVLSLALAGVSFIAGSGVGGALLLLLVFFSGEVLLDTLAAVAAERLASHLGGALLFFSYPLWPLVRLRMLIKRFAERRLGAGKPQQAHEEFEEELMAMVSAGERDGVIEKTDREVIEGVFSLKDRDVSEIMTPRTDIICIEVDASVDELQHLAMSSGHSRIPVYQGTRDNIVGIISVRDILAYWNQENRDRVRLRDIMRQPLFIPASRKVSGLLKQMQRHRMHMAILIDEYGGTAGLVTLEDIIEEFVGDIADEYKRSQPPLYERLPDATYRVKARMRVDELNQLLGVQLPEEEDYATVGGLLVTRLGYIPRAGEKVTIDGLEFTIVAASERRIDTLAVKRAEG